MPSVGEKEKF